MNKLYLILWASKYDPDWHCHFVNANKELADLQYKIDCMKNPSLIHHLIEIDAPKAPEPPKEFMDDIENDLTQEKF